VDDSVGGGSGEGGTVQVKITDSGILQVTANGETKSA
jgi:hypothetical protein